MTISRLLLLPLLFLAMMAPSQAQQDLPSLTVGVQESGTVQWEIETILSRHLDREHGFQLLVRPLADSRAGQIALQAGEVDVILSDFVWVSLQRQQGNTVTMVPHSLAVGGLMLPPGSTISALEDLVGKTIGVAGGPVDKSWVILQAAFNKQTGQVLADVAKANFGAPPLVNELLTTGRIHAALNFWQWNARAKVGGAAEFIAVADMLADLGVSEQPPLLGWTFTQTTATEKEDSLTGFLEASFEAKQVLLSSDQAWDDLRQLMNAGDDDALFAQLRDDYRAGIVRHYDPADTAAAAQTFALLAQYGGPDVVGSATELAPGTFWEGFAK